MGSQKKPLRGKDGLSFRTGTSSRRISGHTSSGKSDAGCLGVWFLGLWVLLLAFAGGIGLFMWRGVRIHQDLAAVADAAAVAGAAGGLDTKEYRRSGLLLLDRPLAREIAISVLGEHEVTDNYRVLVEDTAVIVELDGEITPFLLPLLGPARTIEFTTVAVSDLRKSG